MPTRLTVELRPHPDNAKIYGDHADADLIESVREKGILNPLLITSAGIIINGHRRYEAAQKCGMHEVPVVLFGSDDELDVLEALIESNRQRVKSHEQLGRETQALREIYEKRAGRGRPSGENQHQDVELKPLTYEQIGRRIGTSHNFAREAAQVVDAIDKLENSGRNMEAQELRTKLNHSVKAAYEDGKKAGHIQTTAPKREAPVQSPPLPIAKQDYITLDNYRKLSNEGQAEIFGAENTGKKFNKQETGHIEWAAWSWNPITGCKHTCPYCYARDIANRFYPTKFEPTLWPERLYAPMNTPLPREAETDIGYKNVFTCSMADLFGRWVPTEWITRVLDVIADNPQWNFLFLTKFPIRMAEFEFPDNAWVGTSVDCQIRVKPVEDAFSRVRAKVKWLSCEPMIEPLKFSSLEMFSWVVIGGASKSTQTPEWVPPRVWVSDLEHQARAAGCMVYEKTNLQPIERLREFPGQRMNYDRVVPEALRYLPEVEQIAR